MPLMDTAELARELGVSLRTVRRHAAAGLIPVVRIGSRVRYDWDEVKSVLNSQAKPVAVADKPGRDRAVIRGPQKPAVDVVRSASDTPEPVTSLEPGKIYRCGHCESRIDNPTTERLPVSTACPICGKGGRWS